MKRDREETFELGYVDVPKEYFKLEKNKKMAYYNLPEQKYLWKEEGF